jgi:hypothetical protein
MMEISVIIFGVRAQLAQCLGHSIQLPLLFAANNSCAGRRLKISLARDSAKAAVPLQLLERSALLVIVMHPIKVIDLTDDALVGSIPSCIRRVFGSRRKGAGTNEAN